MNVLISVLPTLIVLGVLILIHEYGHFLACRFSKVKVEKFSIGFGPEIFHWQGRETRYVVSLFPLGGYVKPAGESWSEVGEGGPKTGDYLAAPLLNRMVIVCAGVFMNYVLAFALFVMIFMLGRPIPGTTIGSFIDGYPAAESGLMKGDRITAINGSSVQSWVDMISRLEQAPEQQVTIDFDRSGETLTLQVPLKIEEAKDIFGQPVTVKRLGITPNPKASVFEKYGPVQAVKAAWDTTVFLTVNNHKAIFYLFTGRMSLKAMSGPIGIISMTGDAAKLGFSYVLQLMANLSISLAVINLLPIPALDGGHFFFLLVEAVRRKKVSLAFQDKATQVGFALLLVFMGFVIYNDLVNLQIFSKVKDIILPVFK